MKKKLFIINIIFMIICMIFSSIAFAVSASTPIYDASFDNNKGALFANGTPITIKDNSGTPTAYWDGGSQAITADTIVFGGGNKGTDFDSSKIVMESGTIKTIVAGGYSNNELSPAKVKKTEIIINGGKITNSVYGGGLFYSVVTDSYITQNGGKIGNLVGGGCASATIDSISYNTGTKDATQNSKTTVTNSLITMNDGECELLFGGGQGYSSTTNTKVVVNGGNIGYVTAGGSNGYTNTSEIIIKKGTINILQSTNRGTFNNASVSMTGGTVKCLYIGREKADDIDGTIGTVKVDILGGTVANLYPGTNKCADLKIEGTSAKVVYVPTVVKNNKITDEGATSVNYKTHFPNPYIAMYKYQTRNIIPVITTSPEGYEYLFNKTPITWSSEDETIAAVENGVISGVNVGKTKISATIMDQTAVAQVTVSSYTWILIAAMLMIFLMIVLIFFLYQFFIINVKRNYR